MASSSIFLLLEDSNSRNWRLCLRTHSEHHGLPTTYFANWQKRGVLDCVLSREAFKVGFYSEVLTILTPPPPPGPCGEDNLNCLQSWSTLLGFYDGFVQIFIILVLGLGSCLAIRIERIKDRKQGAVVRHGGIDIQGGFFYCSALKND